MPLAELTITQLLAEYWIHDGDLLKSLWFDWFCPDDQLARRGRNLMMRVRELAGSPLFDADCYRVFFKNLNEPEPFGEDQIHIVPMDESSSLPSFVVSPPSVDGGMASYWIPSPDGKGGPVYGIGTWAEVLQSVFWVPLPSSLLSPMDVIPPGEETWPVVTLEDVQRAFAGTESDLFRIGEDVPPERRKDIAEKLVISENDILALYDAGFDSAPDLHRSRSLAVTKWGIVAACDGHRWWMAPKKERRTLPIPWRGIGWLKADAHGRVLKCGSLPHAEFVPGFTWDWNAEIETAPLSERDMQIICNGVRKLAEMATGEELTGEPEK